MYNHANLAISCDWSPFSFNTANNFMTAADSAVVLLELNVQWDLAGTH